MSRLVFMLVVCLSLLGLSSNGFCEMPVKIVFFYGETCPHCLKQKPFLQHLQSKYKTLQVQSFEVWKSPDNAKLLAKLMALHSQAVTGVPVTFVGDFAPIVGYHDEHTTGAQIESLVKDCLQRQCPDPLAKLSRSSNEPKTSTSPSLESTKAPSQTHEPKAKPKPQATEPPISKPQSTPVAKKPKTDTPPAVTFTAPSPEAKDNKTVQTNTVAVPFLGQIDISKLSLPILTLVLASLDSFNPCAFFVLLTLLSMLTHAKTKSRILVIGGVFVFFSGFIYFLFMSAWLNLFLFIGELQAVTIIAGLIAIFMGAVNVKDFFYFKKGLSLSIPEGAKPDLFKRMRQVLNANSMPTMLIGAISLSVVANSYELLCTAGFPMVFTRALTLNNLSTASYYSYLALYNVIYVIPLFVIVMVFYFTLGGRKLSETQGQVLKLLSGMMMLALGGVLVFKPDALNNLMVSLLVIAVALGLSAVITLLKFHAFKKPQP